MTTAEQRHLDDALSVAVASSSAWQEWVADPTRYLAELDPETVAVIVADVSARLTGLRARAHERGWDAKRPNSLKVHG